MPWLLLFCLFVLYPSSASADVGLPMIFLSGTAYFWAFVPVVLIEAYVLTRVSFSRRDALIWSSFANLLTTLIGIPLTWLVLLLIEMLLLGGGCHEVAHTFGQQLFFSVLRSPWMCHFMPYMNWQVVIGYFALLVPFFFVSWKVEAAIIRWGNQTLSKSVVDQACFIGNLLSYALLALYPLTWPYHH